MSNVADFFIFRTPMDFAGAGQAAEPKGAGQGVFVDAKSLASFPIAAAVVTTISQIAVKVLGGDLAWVALAVALAVGALIFAITMSDPGARPKSLLNWAIAVAIAIVNSLLLYAAVIGIDQLAGKPVATGKP